MIEANNPKLESWVEVPEGNDFPIQNLPYGIFKADLKSVRVGVAIGNKVLDLAELNSRGLLSELEIHQSVFENQYLNDLMALGRPKWRALRQRISELLRKENTELQNNPEAVDTCFHEQSEVQMQMPVKVGDYTDFYSSKEHATNVGTMFRDPENALLPNWKHIPVGYHGRASSIVVSGTDIHRPKGQTKAPDAEKPSFGPTRLLDFELEVAFVVGEGNKMGDNISIEEAEDHIFGLVLFNDWSARDIQKWEYVPLGPFLAKSFASSISPWIVTMDALQSFKTASPKQEPEPLPYLQHKGEKNYDINLEVAIATESLEEKTVCQSNFKYMYWTMAQQLAHHTVNGCNMRIGDMCASGTISGADPSSFGSMLELSWRGTKPIKMPDGSERKFINDNDTVVIRGFAERDGVRVGFGEVRTKVLPAK